MSGANPAGRTETTAARAGRRPPSPPQPETELSRHARYRWAGRIGALCLRLLGLTWRVKWEVPETVLRMEREGRPYLHAFWHAHILTLTYTHRGRGDVVLVSRHGDGEYISQVIHRLGFGTVRGSSSHGGLRSLLEMARLGRSGHPLAVTPDGPRGPRHRLQPGVLLIAQRGGLPVVPLASAARWCRFLRSWDRFEIPIPFSRVAVAVGEPIHVPAGLAQEAMVAECGSRIEEALRRVEERAQFLAGRRPEADESADALGADPVTPPRGDS